MRVVVFLLALVISTSFIQVLPHLSQLIYYGSMLAVSLFLIFQETGRINILLAVVLLSGIVSIYLNSIPAFFKPVERFGSFLVVVLLTSGLVSNKSFKFARIWLFRYLNKLIIAIVVLSFLGYFTGIYRGIGIGNTFKGLTFHSMLLGPLAAITLLNAIWIYTSKGNKWRLLLIVLMAISFLVLLLAGSRGALVGGGLAVLVFLLKLYQKQLGKSFAYLIVLVLLTASTYSFWGAYTGKLEEKMQYSQKNNDIFFSRRQLWDYRMLEFSENPLYGIGFASAKYGLINNKNGVIEPGSSWGVILAQVGLLGFIPFLLLVLRYLVFLLLDKSSPQHAAYLLALLFFFVIHWFVEGYIFASGAFLCLFSWLVLGIVGIFKSGLKFSFI